MRAIVLIFVFFLSFIQNILAQEWVESGSLKTISVDLKHKRGGDFLQNEMNSMLGSIAYTHKKPVESINVKWELISSYQVFREEKGNFKSEIFIKPQAPHGDLSLYEFNSAEYILPALKSFRLSIFKEDSSLVYIKHFNQNPISVVSVGQIAHFSFLHQRWAKGWYMEIDHFEFMPNMGNYTFEQWFQYTNDYKAANYLVEVLSQNYRQLQQSMQEPGSFLIKSLRQADYLNNLFQMPFYQATVIEEKDPDNLQQKMNILSTLFDLNIEKYISLFKESISSGSISIENLVDAYLTEEENLLALQQNYGSIYDNLFQQLTKTIYPTNLSYREFNFFEIVRDYYTERKMHSSSFENRLYSKSIANIDNLIKNQQFAEALYSIENLESFVVDSKVLVLNNTFNQYKANAAYGIYYSYIQMIDKAIKIKNTKLAIQYIKKASIVQETYPKQIITNSLVEKKLQLLLDDCYSDFNQMLAQNRYSEMAAKRDTICELIKYFQLTGVETILDQMNGL